MIRIDMNLIFQVHIDFDFSSSLVLEVKNTANKLLFPFAKQPTLLYQHLHFRGKLKMSFSEALQKLKYGLINNFRIAERYFFCNLSFDS